MSKELATTWSPNDGVSTATQAANNPERDPKPAGSPSPPGLRRRMRKARNRFTRRLGIRFGAALIRRMARTCETTELGSHNREAAEAEHGAILIALWHGRGVIGSPFFLSSDTTVLVSASEDGSLATTILGRLGYEIIRGSSSRGGVRALREMITTLKHGKHVAITPDGPRGPMHTMSPGVAFLARATGTPVLPVGYGYDRAWHLKTWDRYSVPRSGSRIVACYGEPVIVPREASVEELAACSALIRTRIRQAELEAFAHLGLEPDWIDWVPEEPAVRREEDEA